MDVERRQLELIEQYVKQAAVLEGTSLAVLVAEATSHPALFAFSDILSVPSVSKLEGTPYADLLAVLRLFAYGTWSDYRSNASSLPSLLPDQIRKLKQLTVLTLAETEKVLSYDKLMQEIDVSNVRELEDFLINECMHVGIVRGKLDQLRKCVGVQFVAGRDLKPGQLDNMIETLTKWLDTSNSLLQSFQDKIRWVDQMGEADKNHQKEVEGRMEEAKKLVKANEESGCNEDVFDSDPGLMDFQKDRVGSKRRRRRGNVIY